MQIVLTDELAGLLAAAVGITISAHEQNHIVQLTDEELTEYQRLAVFLTAVASEPERFPLRESLAKGLKKKVRAAKGPAQPQSRKKKKKRTQSQQKRDRAQRRLEAQQHNEAREAYDKDRVDLESYIEERQAQIESEPKFVITDIAGNTILAGVPESMIRPMPEEGVEAHDSKPELILPSGVRA